MAQTFGAGILPTENRVFTQFARSALKGDDIILHTPGNSMGNYCYSRDAIKAILTVLIHGQDGEAYNVVNEKTTMTIREMAHVVADCLSNGKSHVIYEIPQDNIYGYAAETKMRLSSKKIESLGWKPEIDLEEAFLRMAESIR